tara:strand:- start:305 stop:1618 length:1314 start_codon:yes stop_codon:yes gene_type:complete
MAESRNKVIIDIILNRAEEANAQLENLQENVSRIGKASNLAAFNRDLAKTNLRVNQMGDIVEATTGEFVDLSDALNRQLRLDQFNERLQTARRVLLGVGLASLFFGMAIRNAAQNAIKSFAQTFTTATEGTLLYNQTLGRLSAGFEFLKFSIMDAFLASTFGKILIEFLLDMIDIVTDLPPGFQAMIIPILLLTALIGFLLMIFGQVSLVLLGIVEILELAVHHPRLMAKILGKIRLIFGIIFTVIAAILIIFGTISLLIKIWNSEGHVFKKILVTVIVLIIAMVALAMLFGLAINLPLIAALALIIAIGIALKLAAAEMKLAFFKTLKAIGEFMVKALLEPINRVIRAFNRVRAIVGKSKIAEITGPSFSGLDSLIQGAESEVAANRAARAEKDSGTAASEKGMIFNIENINSNNADEFITSLKETSLFNKGAGIG